jgi:hypothetical protein
MLSERADAAQNVWGVPEEAGNLEELLSALDATPQPSDKPQAPQLLRVKHDAGFASPLAQTDSRRDVRAASFGSGVQTPVSEGSPLKSAVGSGCSTPNPEQPLLEALHASRASPRMPTPHK